MSSFVLVHGSGQRAGAWSRVRTRLEARGHHVACPELMKSAPDAGLADYAAEIARSVEAPDTVVAAHSFSGVFLPLVAEERACGLLVFLAAVVPEPGKSVRDQLAADGDMFNAAWLEAGPRWFDEAERDSLAREFLFHDCDEETLAWALAQQELTDTRHLAVEPCPLKRWPRVAAAAIVAREDRTLTATWCRRVSRRVLGVEALEVSAGHCPHMSRPAEIAAALETLAEQRRV